MTFQDAQRKLLAQVLDRIRNGEFTESGFARLMGISQPHAHHALKGVRKLSPPILDSILNHFHMSLLDLVPIEEVQVFLQRHAEAGWIEVPFLNAPVGPGLPWPAGLNRRKRFPLPFPAASAPSNLIMANLAADPNMQSILNGYDVALLDTSEFSRSKVTPEGLYVIEAGDEAILRFIRPGARGYYLISEATLDTPARWPRLPVSASALSEVVKARVRWLGRERDRELPADQRGRFLYDAISS